MDIPAFIVTVDQVAQQFPGLSQADHAEVAEKVGIVFSGTTQLKTEFEQIIRESMLADHGSSRWELRRLCDNLLLRHFILGESIDPYFAVASLLWDFTNGHKYVVTDTQAPSFSKAIEAALAYDRISPHDHWHDPELMAKLHRKQKAISEAAKRISCRGIKIEIEQDQVIITDEDLQTLTSDIESNLTKLNTSGILGTIFGNLSRDSYNADLERYSLVRRPSSLGDAKPQIPFGFILQLALKKPTLEHESAKNPEETWKLIIKDSTDLATICNVQPYSIFELMYRDTHNIIEHTRNLAIYDTIYTFLQLKPSYLPTILLGLFDWTEDNECLQKLGFTQKHVVDISSAILKEAGNDPHRPFEFTKDWLYRSLNSCFTTIIDRVLEYFTWTDESPNAEYTVPYDHTKINSWDKPLIQLNDDHYLLPNRSLFAISFYESLASALRTVYGDKTVQNNVGLAAERTLHKEFAKHGITTRKGNYHSPEGKGECDLLIETPDRILVFEMKMKALLRKSRSGHDVGLLTDLSESLVRGQTQLGKIEYSLRKKGEIILQTEGKEYTVKLNGRSVERIFVSGLDYGAFNDRTFLQQFLAVAVKSRFGVEDPTYKKDIEKFNERCKALTQNCIDLEKLFEEKERHFFNCWFLSLPQILTHLDNANNAEEFSKSLLSTRHIVFGTQDNYFDTTYMASIKSIAKE